MFVSHYYRNYIDDDDDVLDDIDDDYDNNNDVDLLYDDNNVNINDYYACGSTSRS